MFKIIVIKVDKEHFSVDADLTSFISDKVYRTMQLNHF